MGGISVDHDIGHAMLYSTLSVEIMRPSSPCYLGCGARAAFASEFFFLLDSPNPATTKHDHHLFLTYALFFLLAIWGFRRTWDQNGGS